MKRLDDDKVSLVDFVRSIKFARPRYDSPQANQTSMHFAHFEQRVNTCQQISAEDSKLIRSAN